MPNNQQISDDDTQKPPKKNTSKIIIWLASVLLLCCFTGCLFMLGGASATALPHANIKILIQPDTTAEQAIDKTEDALLSLGYIQQPNDWEDWINILDPEKLELKKKERRYTKGDFEIFYDPESGDYATIAFHLHFYENGGYLFTEAGFAEFEALRTAVDSVGLEESLENDPRFPGRKISTPEMFNNEQQSPIMQLPRVAGILLALIGLLFYGVAIIWPGFWIASKLLNHLMIPNSIKRIVFILASSLLLTPGLTLLTPFGPPALLPLPLALIFALAAPPLLYLLAISFGCTAILSLIVSLRIWRPHSIST